VDRRSGTAAVDRLAPDILRAAGLGVRGPVTSVTRLAGGSKKGVYRVGCSDGFSVVLYVWSAAEDFWPADASGADASGADASGADATFADARGADATFADASPAGSSGGGGASGGAGDGGAADAGVFGHASGLGLFSAAAQRLSEAGVRVPVVYLTDASQALYPADIALVEDVRGGTLEELLAADPAAAAPVMERLGEMLRSMWERRAARVGRVADVAELGDVGDVGFSGVGVGGASSEGIVLERALRQLAGAADRVPSIAAVRPRLEETLRALAASVRPRASYGLIHGELGPDHVSIDDRGQPVVVDIEGAMYFDVEWEHVFLRLRFGRDYEWLRVSGLDEHRMSLYALALDLSLIEGPLRLLDGDYPDREEMLAIVGWAVDRVLRTANGDRQALAGGRGELRDPTIAGSGVIVCCSGEALAGLGVSVCRRGQPATRTAHAAERTHDVGGG
jgi:Phosphotransferase enzyme family